MRNSSDKLCRRPVGIGVGVGVDEAAAVGGHGHIEQRGGLGIQQTQRLGQLQDDLPAGGLVRLTEKPPGIACIGGMVVDAQVYAPGRKALRIEILRRQVHRQHRVGLKAVRCDIRCHKGRVHGRHLGIVVKIRRLAHPAQDMTKGGGTAKRVAVRADMRQQQISVAVLQIVEGLIKRHHRRHVGCPGR